MAQRPRPTIQPRVPQYPRLSTLAIAAALTACVGQVQVPGDGSDGESGGQSGTKTTVPDTGNPAGGMVVPYGGAGGAAGETSQGGAGPVATTHTAGSGGVAINGSSAGLGPLSFGGFTSATSRVGGTGGAIPPRTTASTIPMLNGAAPLSFAGAPGVGGAAGTAGSAPSSVRADTTGTGAAGVTATATSPTTDATKIAL